MPSLIACALISQDVYNDESRPIVGYRPVSIAGAKAINATGSSFFGAAYRAGETGVIAFRGSKERQDWTDADVDIARGRLPVAQLGDAAAFFSCAQAALSRLGCSRFVVVGHSLGGGLAEIVAAAVTRVPVSAATFNAPGLMSFTRAGSHASLRIPARNSNLFNVRVRGDLVSLRGQHAGQVYELPLPASASREAQVAGTAAMVAGPGVALVARQAAKSVVAHYIGTVIQALLASPLASMKV